MVKGFASPSSNETEIGSSEIISGIAANAVESVPRRNFVFMSRRVVAYSFGKKFAALQKKWAELGKVPTTSFSGFVLPGASIIS